MVTTKYDIGIRFNSTNTWNSFDDKVIYILKEY